ncbi:MAG: hypothetical protein AAF620_18990 [Bacteroidota bacterium]
MRVFQGNSAVSETILLTIVNLLLVVVLLLMQSKIPTILISVLLINSLGYYFISSGLYYFEVNSKKMIVRNLWRPWVENEYMLEEIDFLKVNDAVNIGKILTIHFKNIQPKGWSCNLSEESLEDLINYIEKFKSS